jgi:hypothetical protein
MVYMKNDSKNIKTTLDPVGFITLPFQTFQVCWIDPVQLKFRKECGFSSTSKGVERISETGTLDKVTGSFWYENIYQYEGKTYWHGYAFNCKRVNSPVVQ